MIERVTRAWLMYLSAKSEEDQRARVQEVLAAMQYEGAHPSSLIDLSNVMVARKQGGEAAAKKLTAYYQALQTKDFNAASQRANEWLSELHASGASPGTLTELQTVTGSVILELQKVAVYGSGAGCDFGAGEGDNADAIDRYEPDSNYFYVLDAKSGAQLERVLEKLRMAVALAKRKARVPNRLLFIGLPGTGKTAGAKWLAFQLNLPVALIRIDGVVGAKVGETARRLRAAFEEARDGVIVIDELDAVSVNRGDKNPNVGQWDKQTTTALNQLLDSLPYDRIVIGCTNVPEAIDPSVLRRMRTHVHFGPPDKAAREAMLREWWSAAPYSDNAWKRLIEGSEGKSGDFLERVAEEANSTAALRGEDEKINAEDVHYALLNALATDKAVALAGTMANGSLSAPLAPSAEALPPVTVKPMKALPRSADAVADAIVEG
jgi:ATP-dependent Zn protease